MSRLTAHKPFKPWRNFAEQLEALSSKGLEIDNESKALEYLERLGYYRLSGYLYPFRELNSSASSANHAPLRLSQFRESAKFHTAVELYVFDKKLRILALDALERIEMAVRVDIAYLLGQKDPLAHKNPSLLHGHFSKQIKVRGPAKGKTMHQVWLEKYESMLHRARKEPFVEHHQQVYGDLPIWVAIEVWDFGLMSKMYEGMKFADRDSIAEKYGAKDRDEFADWLKSFNFIRNVSAHHSRLWNINILERSSVPNYLEGFNLNNEKPFLYFCLMKKMLDTICPNSSWWNRFINLTESFPEDASVSIKLEDLGVVPGWQLWNV